jgi:hypothetical protein
MARQPITRIIARQAGILGAAPGIAGAVRSSGLV